MTIRNHNGQVRDADGVAVEHVVALVNSVNASAWVSLPRAAHDTDTYATNYLSYVATQMAPGLSLTVEYGTDGPGWLGAHLPNATRLLGAIARRVWAAAGRPEELLKVVIAAPGARYGIR